MVSHLLEIIEYLEYDHFSIINLAMFYLACTEWNGLLNPIFFLIQFEFFSNTYFHLLLGVEEYDIT